jgi:hypothetical protein
MARNGSGTYSLPTPFPSGFQNGTTIDAPTVNSVLTDLQSAMTASVAADGQTPISGNWTFGGYNITGIATLGVTNVVATALATSGGATVGNALAVTKGGATISAGGVTVTGDSSITGILTVSAPGTAGNQVVNFSQFTTVGGPTGSVTLPTGVIVKWGVGTCTSGTGAVDYTTEGLLDFPTATWWVSCALNPSGASHTDYPPGADPASYTAAGFNVYNGTGQSIAFSWIAIGH